MKKMIGSLCLCVSAVLCELWWGSAAAWSQLCEWPGSGLDAKQPLWEDFQTRHTQEVQYAWMQDQRRSVCLTGKNVTSNFTSTFDRWATFLFFFTQFQPARKIPCHLAFVTNWSCWVAALSGRSKDSAVSPVGRNQDYTPIYCITQWTLK